MKSSTLLMCIHAGTSLGGNGRVRRKMTSRRLPLQWMTRHMKRQSLTTVAAGIPTPECVRPASPEKSTNLLVSMQKLVLLL